MEFIYYKGFDRTPVRRNSNQCFAASEERINWFKTISPELKSYLRNLGFRIHDTRIVGSAFYGAAQPSSDLDLLVQIKDNEGLAAFIYKEIAPLGYTWMSQFRKDNSIGFFTELFYDFHQADGRIISSFNLELFDLI